MLAFINDYLASGIRLTTPILLAALGCIVTEWTKDLQVGLEGGMLFGAFFGVVFGMTVGSSAGGLALTVLLGVIAGLIFGYITAVLKVNVFVAGVVVNVLGAGGTVYLLRSLYGVKGTLSDDRIPKIPVLDIPLIKDVPILGGVLSGHNALTYVAWILTIAMAWAVRRTVIVRHLKAAGEHPEALATAGGNVNAMRIAAQAWCFALCGLAGAQISTGQLSLFTEGMTSGIGFVALAAVIFSRGRIGLLASISVVFGLSAAGAIQISPDVVPPQFSQMLPYVIALLGLIVLAKARPGQASRIATPKVES